jgi:hypothetical protein
MRRATPVAVRLVPLPARHHRAQDEVGELGPRDEHRAQLRALEGDHVGRLVRDALGDRRLAGEGGDVAEEGPGVRLRDPDVLPWLAVEHPHVAALDDEERGVALALLVKRLAGRERTACAELRQALELLRRHPREHDLVPEVGEALRSKLGGCRALDRHALYEEVAEPLGPLGGQARRSMKR